MDQSPDSFLHNDDAGQPVWKVALFFPKQGGWTESDYLSLDGGPLVEFDDGHVEVLDIPTKEHQRIVQFLFLILHQFVTGRSLGEVFTAPLPVRLWPRKFREPDLLFVDAAREEVNGYPAGADLVVEVVSPGADNRRRDLEIKPIEYAQAEIAEYWVVDPENRSVTVHTLKEKKYQSVTHGPTDSVQSQRLPGLSVPVQNILAAANP